MYIFGILSMLCFTFCFVPQILSILKTKNVSGLSLGLWLMVVFGHATGLVYALYLRVPILIASYTMGLALSLWTLMLFLRHRERER
jgi:MtN3 and saliva related transmembrane protein